MNDFERRLRDLGEKARDEVRTDLVPRAAHVRRIGRRRLIGAGSAFLSVALVVAGAAAAVSGGDDGRAPVPPAREGRVEPGDRCAELSFEPTYMPRGFAPAPPPDDGRVGIVGRFERGRATFIEVTTERHFQQTRPRTIEVLGARGTIGDIHEGWSVEFRHRKCDYVLHAYGISRPELRLFAAGLTSVQKPAVPEHGVAVWPEDTRAEAGIACAEAGPRERTQPAVVSAFAMEVLGWDSPIYSAPEEGSVGWRVVPSARDAYGGAVEAGVTVFTVEVEPGCWSVGSVSRLPDRRPTGVGISVRGREVSIGFDPLGAASARIEVGYGDRRTRAVWDSGLDEPHVLLDLGFEPAASGHFLVLFEDEEGRVFSATGGPLPAGDFAAG
ncbi:MAG TPA: hypothetical protein VHN37_09010 [Actinomycetota bacterium]|nr:hypothetical protein [Actinomycetota bacterium]